MPELSLLAPGTPVTIDGVKGVVTRVTITANLSVVYEVGWWNGNDYQEKWFYPFQLLSCNPQTLKIGFKTNGT